MNSVLNAHPAGKRRVGLQVLGWIALAGAAPLSLRFIYEQTLLTWRRGPQMVGFALAHTHIAFLLFGTVCEFLAIAFVAFTATILLKRKLRHEHSPSILKLQM